MNLSVIVPCFKQPESLERCLKAIRSSQHCEFELIVVDDGSPEPKVRQVGEKFAHHFIRHPKNLGRAHARTTGMKAAKGDLFIFIDADIVITPRAIAQIRDHMVRYPEDDALCGRLSKEHPNRNFFSQYKNLYMHYIFENLPRRINFIFGSIHAIRKKSLQSYTANFKVAEDTWIGQKLASEGKLISLLKNLEVVHLKKYDFISWVKNDFRIPFHWGLIFIRHQGWRQLFENHTGYLHASRSQLASLILATLIALHTSINPFNFFNALLLVTWFLLNFSFFSFLRREKGTTFFISSILATFFDHLIMVIGIVSGFLCALLPLHPATRNQSKRPLPS